MRYIVFSDVDGNLPALETMLKDAGPAEGYICLGDTVDYGPWANECVKLIDGLPNRVVLEGNHEHYFLKGEYQSTNHIAQAFFDFCYPTFTQFDLIKDLPQTYELKGFTFAHTIRDQYVYPDSDIELDNNYVVGHSHHQFKIEQAPYALYNPGSVGQNRKYINVINYIVLETDTMDFTMKAITYDESLIINEMKKRQYPQICIDYYNNKQRV